MHSIRTKLTAVTLTAILISVLTVGTAGIFSLKDLGDSSSRQILSLLCEREAQSLELYFSSVMQTVETVSNYAEHDLTEISDVTMQYHVSDVMEVFSILAESTQGVMTFYYRVAPEISASSSGFWFYRDAEGRFIRHELTDVEAYDEDDISHVGWYSIPKERGEAVWMNPYYNENLGAMMISYVRPIYSEGKFIGVIGVDIDYATLVDRVDGTTAFRSGYAFLRMRTEKSCITRIRKSEAIPSPSGSRRYTGCFQSESRSWTINTSRTANWRPAVSSRTACASMSQLPRRKSAAPG